MKADVVVGLQLGDEAKGKITHHLLKSGRYTHCIRFNGSHNAGHSIYHNGRKFITHMIPAGVFFDNVDCIVGPGCVINPDKFIKELNELQDNGINAQAAVRVAYNAHVIQDKHLEEDADESKIGTTRMGNGPAYRDKYGRTGMRAESCDKLKPYLTDMYKELFSPGFREPFVLLEGGQGFFLDPDWTDNYPYNTSSHCTVAAALQNGVPYNSIRRVYGAAKVYETYSGFDESFQPNDDVFNKIGDAGKEFGATTGRRRKIRFVDPFDLRKAVQVNGVTHLVMSKLDILREVDVWGIRYGKDRKYNYGKDWKYLSNEEEFRMVIEAAIPPEVEIIWSSSPEGI